MRIPSGGEKTIRAAFRMMFLILAVGNVLLIRQNLRMRHALNELASVNAGPLQGQKLAPFRTLAVSGDVVDVSYPGTKAKRVFIYFSPSCTFSQAQFAYWRQLLERIDRNRFEVIGLASEVENAGALRQYLESIGLAAPPEKFRVALLPDALRRKFNLSVTPTTVVVSNDGTVEKVWQGKWSLAELKEASAVFDLDLSDITLSSEPDDQACSTIASTVSP